MQSIITNEMAAQRIAALHEEAARQHLLRELRVANVASLPSGPQRGGRVRLSMRRSRPVAA